MKSVLAAVILLSVTACDDTLKQPLFDAQVNPGRDGSAQMMDPADGSVVTTQDGSMHSPLDGGIATADMDVSVDDRLTRYSGTASRSPITPSVVGHMRAVAADTSSLWQDVFMKVGDSNTVNTNNLACLSSASSTTLDSYASALTGVLEHFRSGSAAGSTPFARVSSAAGVGQSIPWALGTRVQTEYDALYPAFAFVGFGTNDMEQGTNATTALPGFYENLNELIDQIEGLNVIPIVVGLPPRTDNMDDARWVPTYDAFTRAIAEQRQLPYISLYNALKSLPDSGASGDGIHSNAYSGGACNFSSAALQYGFNTRNLLELQTLNDVWRTFVEGQAAPDAPDASLTGDGTREHPYVIDRLPFTHYADTSFSTSREINSYAGCSTGQNESGAEIYYELRVTSSTPMRLAVMDVDSTDVDVHILNSSDTCIKRGDKYAETTLNTGTYTVVVDTFVNGSGVELFGGYTLVAIACESGDARCN